MLCNKFIASSSHLLPYFKDSFKKGIPPANTNCSCLEELSFNKQDKDFKQAKTMSCWYSRCVVDKTLTKSTIIPEFSSFYLKLTFCTRFSDAKYLMVLTSLSFIIGGTKFK